MMYYIPQQQSHPFYYAAPMHSPFMRSSARAGPRMHAARRARAVPQPTPAQYYLRAAHPLRSQYQYPAVHPFMIRNRNRDYMDDEDEEVYYRHHESPHGMRNAFGDDRRSYPFGATSFSDEEATVAANNYSAMKQQQPAYRVAAKPQQQKPIEKVEHPTANIDDSNDQYFKVTLDVPGYKSSDIEVNIEDDDTQRNDSTTATKNDDNVILTIKGHRHNRIYHAKFQKRFRLRESRLKLEELDAQLLDGGVLTITLPKKQQQRPQQQKSIPIRIVPFKYAPMKTDETEEAATHTTASSTTTAADTSSTSSDHGNESQEDAPAKTKETTIEVETVSDDDDDDDEVVEA